MDTLIFRTLAAFLGLTLFGIGSGIAVLVLAVWEAVRDDTSFSPIQQFCLFFMALGLSIFDLGVLSIGVCLVLGAIFG